MKCLNKHGYIDYDDWFRFAFGLLQFCINNDNVELKENYILFCSLYEDDFCACIELSRNKDESSATFSKSDYKAYEEALRLIKTNKNIRFINA